MKITNRMNDFAKVYIPEKAALLEVLTEGAPALLSTAKQLVEFGYKTLRGEV